MMKGGGPEVPGAGGRLPTMGVHESTPTKVLIRRPARRSSEGGGLSASSSAEVIYSAGEASAAPARGGKENCMPATLEPRTRCAVL
jgi:hypothetical protein